MYSKDFANVVFIYEKNNTYYNHIETLNDYLSKKKSADRATKTALCRLTSKYTFIQLISYLD